MSPNITVGVFALKIGFQRFPAQISVNETKIIHKVLCVFETQIINKVSASQTLVVAVYSILLLLNVVLQAQKKTTRQGRLNKLNARQSSTTRQLAAANSELVSSFKERERLQRFVEHQHAAGNRLADAVNRLNLTAAALRVQLAVANTTIKDLQEIVLQQGYQSQI